MGEALNDALQQKKMAFAAANSGNMPTYGDCLVTPAFGTLENSGCLAVVHVLGADCSNRPKRYPVPMFTPKGDATCATVFAAYFRTFAAVNFRAAQSNERGTLGL